MTVATATTGHAHPKPTRRTPETIAHLVTLAATGDQPSANALVEEFTTLLWSIARAHRLNHADAADTVQTTWLHLLEHIHHLHDPARVGDWLATTARRECLKRLRDQKRTLLLGDDTPDPPSPDPPITDTLIDHERQHALQHAFARLRPTDQTLLRLLTTEPRPTYDEISAALDLPIGSIGPTRQRALDRLRRELHQQDTLTLMTAS